MGRELVLVGGGHAHLTAMLRLDEYTQRHRVTVISSSAYHYYSGMGPGMLSGLYAPQQVRFNIRKMVESRGGCFLEDRVERIDPAERRLYLGSGRTVVYDVVSFNTGSEIAWEGAGDARIIPVKPIINLYRARCAIARDLKQGELQLAVAGAGAAGIELAANLWRLVRSCAGSAAISLVSGGELLAGVPDGVRRRVVASLDARGIRLLRRERLVSAAEGEARLSGGTRLPYDYLFLAVGVRPSGLFAASGLPTGAGGGLLVDRTLQSVAAPGVFGGGDCIDLKGQPLAKVGVYAVRQNPVLYHNLLAALEGRPLVPFDPGGRYLLILNLGDGTGVLWKGRWVWGGRLAFRLKDYIDRRFMHRFQVSGERFEPIDEGIGAISEWGTQYGDHGLL